MQGKGSRAYILDFCKVTTGIHTLTCATKKTNKLMTTVGSAARATSSLERDPRSYLPHVV